MECPTFYPSGIVSGWCQGMGGAGRGWEGNSGCVRSLLSMKKVSSLIPGIFIQKNQAGVDGKGLGLRPQRAVAKLS